MHVKHTCRRCDDVICVASHLVVTKCLERNRICAGKHVSTFEIPDKRKHARAYDACAYDACAYDACSYDACAYDACAHMLAKKSWCSQSAIKHRQGQRTLALAQVGRQRRNDAHSTVLWPWHCLTDCVQPVFAALLTLLDSPDCYCYHCC